MSSVSALGLSLPLWPLLIFSALIVMSLINAVGNRLGQPLRVIDPMINRGIIALICARVAFVGMHWSGYDDLMAILDIRDRGFHIPTLGIVFALGLCQWLYGQMRKEGGAAFFKRTLILFCVGVIWCVGGWWSYQTIHSTPTAWPDYAFESLDGGIVSFAQEEPTEFTVVNLWASWCSSCRAEMPALEQAQAVFPQARLILINQGENQSTVEGYLKQSGYQFDNVWLDPNNKMGQWLGSQAVPVTLVFNKHGELVTGHSGIISVPVLGALLE